MNPWLLLGAVLSLLGATAAGAWFMHKYDVGQEAIAVAKAESHVITVVQKQGVINEAVATKAQIEHDRIVYRTQTLIQRIPQYVTVQADNECVLSRGTIMLLNAASDGMSAIAPGPIESADAPSGVKLDTVAASVVGNYGVANANAAQLKALQDWAAQSGLMAH